VERTHNKHLYPLVVTAITIVVMFSSSSLLSPLYPLYQKAFGFSGLMLTLIYAVYVFGNIVAVLIFGRVSDQIGRRVTVLSAIALAVVGGIVFVFAQGTSWLFLGRIVTGFANSLAIGTLTAWLTELHTRCDKAFGAMVATAANMAGLALGAIFAGLLAQFAPWPLRLPWLMYLGMLIATTVAVLGLPETVSRRVRQWRELSLRPRVGVPPEIRFAFVAPAATAFATFALFGFYLALVPGLLIHDLHVSAPLVAGLVLFEMTAIVAIVTVVSRNVSSRVSMFGALALYFPSLALVLLAQVFHSMPVLLGATVLVGLAGAVGYRGSVEVVNQIAPDARRSEVVSAYHAFCFAGNAVPVIGIGVLSLWVSGLLANVIFAVVIALLAVIAFGVAMRFPGPSANANQRPVASVP
jgi:MFS family permease